MDNKVEERIQWVNGIKGFSCIMVFIHHFCLAFLPAIHYGEEAPSYLNNIDTFLSQSPVSFILNGNFFVVIFCMLSGFVISKQIMCLEDKSKMANIVVKRYFRLMIPVIPIGLIVFLLLQVDGFTNLQAAEITHSQWLENYYQEKIGFMQAIKSILIDIWFYGDYKISTAFWMLSELFYGTFLSAILSTVSWKKTKYTGILYIVVAIFFRNKYLQMAFVFGTILAWIYLEKVHIFNKYVGCIAIIAGMFLGAYPSGVEPTNIYRFLSWRPYGFWHAIGALLLLYGICSCEKVQNILSAKVFRKLGTISYSIFLIHIPLLFSISTTVFLILHETTSEYVMSVLITGAVSVIALVVMAKLYYDIIEKKAEMLSLRIMKVFLDI